MQSASIAAKPAGDAPLSRLIHAPLWAWCLIAVAIFALLDLRADPQRLLTSLGDADDAARLVQVRELIGGASWFDRTLPRIGAPDPLVSHWSRIVDAPLALMLIGFERLFGPATGTLVTRALWPLMVFLPLLYILARSCDRQAGRAGALVALGLTVYAHSGVIQFSPGRIDHHNMMILGAVGGTLLLAESFAVARIGWVAGALLGLGVSVGYEGLGLTAAALATASLIAVWTGRGVTGITNAAVAFATTLGAALVLTETPRQWLDVHCDALAANLVLLAAAGAAGLFTVRQLAADAHVRGRLAVLAAFGAAGCLLYMISQPACLAGPFGHVDATIRKEWLEHVEENQPVWEALKSQPFATAQFLVSAIFGVTAAAWLWRRQPTEANGLLLGATVAGLVLASMHIKVMPYATFLAVVPLAILVAGLPPIGALSALSTRLIGFLAVNQHTILGVMLAVSSIGSSQPAAKAGTWAAMSETLDACTATRNIEPLAKLPAGLIVTDIDFGSFIAALTPHRVMTAPYHRIDKTMLEALALRRAEPGEAERRLRSLRADYVVICRAMPIGAAAPETLLAQLYTGRPPAYLEPVTMPDFTPLRVWRLKPSGAAQ